MNDPRLEILAPFVTARVVSPLGARFAEALARLDPEAPAEALLGGAMASAAVRAGHVCLDLTTALSAAASDDDEVAAEAEALSWPTPARWLEALDAASFVGRDDVAQPLILEGHRLYLQRYWDYERRMVAALSARADDTARLRLVTGGPGAGKTFRIVEDLGAKLAASPQLRIALMAPTGKAAKRMSEAIRQARASGAGGSVAAVPEAATTIHRALGWTPRDRTRFRRHAHHPLLADLVVVDEASMVGQALMTKLVEAVRPDAELWLVGDPHQLASVEAGGVFGALAGWPRLAPRRLHLTSQHRYDPDGGIARLAAAVLGGDWPSARALLEDPGHPEVRWVQRAADEPLPGELMDGVVDHWRGVMDEATVMGAASRLSERVVLCAHRRGRWGSDRLNGLASEALGPRPHGRPILVRENDKARGLFNGDTGLQWQSGAGVRVWFPDGPGRLRDLSPSQLPRHQPCWAMSVHKAQGSSYDEVIVVLPESASPLMTRELLYTAVTRARHVVTVVGPASRLEECVATPTVRASGVPTG